MADNNLSPDMINNLINMLKNGSNNSSAQNTQSNYSTDTNQNNHHKASLDNNQKNQYDTNSQAESSTSNIDFDTIMKMKSIMETLNNSNDQDSKLLYSLKPYLRKSRQEKLDQYINILKITQVSKLFNANSEHKTDSNI